MARSGYHSSKFITTVGGKKMIVAPFISDCVY